MSSELRRVQDDDQYQFSIGGQSPTLAVIEAIAWVTNQDPGEFGPLADVIDPDALDQLVTDSGDVTISFQMEGLEIQVASTSGDIIITER